MNAPAPWLDTKAQPLVGETLARFALDLTPQQVPKAVGARARHLLLDAAGIALASTGFDFAHRAFSAISGLAGMGEVPIIGFPASLPLRDAALLDGILVHGLDYDDTHIAGVVHATASLFPTILTVAAQRHLSGAAALCAYIAGIEAAARIGAVAKGGFHNAGFHPTGLVGAFGATLAAGKLFGLTAEQLVNAQGITLSAAAGSLEFLEDGAWTKRFHPGWAATIGITAAALAQQGFVGARRAYEGRFGLYRSHLQERFDPADLALATAGLGERWEVLQVAVKPYPACHFVHACVDAALALRDKYAIAPQEIERIEALLPQEGVAIVCEPEANKKRPKNSYDAQFSIPYIVAAAFRRGRFTLAELTEETLADPDILGLADRVRYRADPNSGFLKYYSGELQVQLRDGRHLAHREHMNRGCGDRPLSEEEIAAKFEANAGRAVAPQRVRAIREAVLAIDETPDMMALARALGGR